MYAVVKNFVTRNVMVLVIVSSPVIAILFVVMVGNKPGLYVGFAFGAVGAIAMIKPIRQIVLGSKPRAAVAIWVGMWLMLVGWLQVGAGPVAKAESAVAVLTALRTDDPAAYIRHLADLRRLDAPSYLAELKRTFSPNYSTELKQLDPTNLSGYLAELQRSGDPKYFSELKILYPERYATETGAMKIREKEREIERLVGTLHLLNADDAARHVEYYERLAFLAPSRKDFADNLRMWREKKGRTDAVMAEAERVSKLRETPISGMQILDWSWEQGGFGVVMIARFRVKNNNPFPVKDPLFKCTLFGPSGTIIDSISTRVFERIEPGKAKLFRNINMGLIASQSAQGRCELADAVSLP